MIARSYEKLILDGFQAGLSWITILRKRDNFRRAFDDFRPEKIHALQREKDSRADERRRHRPQSRQDRRRGRKRQILSEDHGRRPGFSKFLWDFRRWQAEGQSFQHHGQGAGVDAALDQDFKGTRGRGFKFVGPTIVYAFMQATGMVNDHLVTCFCHESCAGKHRAPRPQSQKMTAGKFSLLTFPPAPGSGCCRGGGSISWIPRHWIIEIADIAHGLARVARWNGQTRGAHISRWRSIRCWSKP